MANYKGGYQIVDLGNVNASGESVEITDEKLLKCFENISNNYLESKSLPKPILVRFVVNGYNVITFLSVGFSDGNLLASDPNILGGYLCNISYTSSSKSLAYVIEEF